LGFALNIAHLWMDAIPIRDHTGNSSGEMNVSNSVANVSLAYRFYRGMYAGISINYLNENLHVVSANRVSFDISYYMFTLMPGLTFGINIKNLGPQIRYGQANESLPLSIRAGMAYNLKYPDMFLALDYVKTNGQNFYFASGVEYIFRKQFMLRIGNRFKNRSLLNPAFGLGLSFLSRFEINYSFTLHEFLNDIHQVGIKYKFGLPYSIKNVKKATKKRQK